MALRYISRGAGLQELMVLAGVGSSLFWTVVFSPSGWGVGELSRNVPWPAKQAIPSVATAPGSVRLDADEPGKRRLRRRVPECVTNRSSLRQPPRQSIRAASMG